LDIDCLVACIRGESESHVTLEVIAHTFNVVLTLTLHCNFIIALGQRSPDFHELCQFWVRNKLSLNFEGILGINLVRGSHTIGLCVTLINDLGKALRLDITGTTIARMSSNCESILVSPHHVDRRAGWCLGFLIP